jgi:chromosome segregation ATPase
LSTHTLHKHLGFTVLFEELEQPGTLAMCASTYAALKTTQDKVDWEFAELRRKNEQLAAAAAGLDRGAAKNAELLAVATAKIAELEKAGAENGLALASLSGSLAEAKAKIAELEKAGAENGLALASLSGSLAEAKAKIAELEKAKTEAGGM